MADGKIKISLEVVANELAELAGTKSTMVYEPINEIYYINGLTEEMLLQNGFEFFQRTSTYNPRYKRADVYAEPNTMVGFGYIAVFKEETNKWGS